MTKHNSCIRTDVMLVQYKKSKKETEKCKRCERRVKNDGWQQTLRNGTTKGRSGKLVASCSRLWNSSAHSCEFCEQQQQRVRPIAVSDGTAARHKQMQPLPLALPRASIPPVTSGPRLLPLLALTSRASANQPANLPAQTALLRTTKWPAQPAVVNCFNREKETHAPLCRRRHSASHRLTNGSPDGETDRRTAK